MVSRPSDDAAKASRAAVKRTHSNTFARHVYLEQEAGREPQPSLRKERASGSQHIAKLPDLMKRPQYLATRHLQPSLSTHRCCAPPAANAIRFVL